MTLIRRTKPARSLVAARITGASRITVAARSLVAALAVVGGVAGCTAAAGQPSGARLSVGSAPGASRSATDASATDASAAGVPAGGRSVPVPAGAQSARVRAVVDGDTLHLIASGSGPLQSGTDERARLLEINAPEIHGTVQCFGPEASAALSQLTPVGSIVRVIADRESHDRFGRPLVYVWNADGVFVNEALVRSGAAVPLLITPNDRFIATIDAAERAARAAKAGQWSACRR